jgi:prepilin-type processing-associated H-X9-DG protein
MCSGAWDNSRDGCMDTWGWVADLVNNNVARPGDMLCPTSAMRSTEKLNDIYGSPTNDTGDTAPVARRKNGICATYGGTTASTSARAAYIDQNLFQKGYNTNYAQSWFMCRSTPNLKPVVVGGKNAGWQSNVQPISYATVDAMGMPSTGSFTKNGMKELFQSGGPLKRRLLEAGPVGSSRVALMGDGAPGDPKDGIASGDIGSVKQGDLLAEAFCDGPAFYDSTDKILLIRDSQDFITQIQVEAAGKTPVPGTPASGASQMYLQDTRDWYALHGGGQSGSCNILMADGSVAEFIDINKDKYLNPGFPVKSGLADYSTMGYTEDIVELEPARMFNGVFLYSFPKLANFEE